MKNKTFRIKHPYAAASLIGILCTFLTALSMAIPQAMRLDTYMIYFIAAISLVISASLGVLIMKKTDISLGTYGFSFRSKDSFQKIWWYAPLILMEILPLVVYGFSNKILLNQYLIVAFLTIAVGFNEEIYFRGLILQFLTVKGRKHAIIGSAIIFGVLHLTNAFNGKNLLYLILQMSFAFLVGFVLAELVSITKSLWVVIIWHASHDFIAMTTEGELDTKALIILFIQVLLLLVYAIKIWKESTIEE